jgi:hypothetical protein
MNEENSTTDHDVYSKPAADPGENSAEVWVYCREDGRWVVGTQLDPSGSEGTLLLSDPSGEMSLPKPQDVRAWGLFVDGKWVEQPGVRVDTYPRQEEQKEDDAEAPAEPADRDAKADPARKWANIECIKCRKTFTVVPDSEVDKCDDCIKEELEKRPKFARRKLRALKSVHVSCDGAVFATAGIDGLVKLWRLAALMGAQGEVSGPRLVARLDPRLQARGFGQQQSSQPVNCVRFHPNRADVLAVGSDPIEGNSNVIWLFVRNPQTASARRLQEWLPLSYGCGTTKGRKRIFLSRLILCSAVADTSDPSSARTPRTRKRSAVILNAGG